MQRLRQRHSDKSQSVIELRNSKWQIQLTVIRPGASSINRVPSQPVTLREAQNLAAKAMEKQNRALLYGRLSPLGRVLKTGCREAFTNRTILSYNKTRPF